MAIAFTVNDYLVWEVAGLNIQVIDLTDLVDSPEPWGGFLDPVGNAQSFFAGFTNTLNIVQHLGSNTTYAARGCNENTNGGAPIGTWYLPALCQMGEGDNCQPGTANININLVQLGFGGLTDNFAYWSSTESSMSPAINAWSQQFGAVTLQALELKNSPLLVRCARNFSGI